MTSMCEVRIRPGTRSAFAAQVSLYSARTPCAMDWMLPTIRCWRQTTSSHATVSRKPAPASNGGGEVLVTGRQQRRVGDHEERLGDQKEVPALGQQDVLVERVLPQALLLGLAVHRGKHRRRRRRHARPPATATVAG